MQERELVGIGELRVRILVALELHDVVDAAARSALDVAVLVDRALDEPRARAAEVRQVELVALDRAFQLAACRRPEVMNTPVSAIAFLLQDRHLAAAVRDSSWAVRLLLAAHVR